MKKDRGERAHFAKIAKALNQAFTIDDVVKAIMKDNPEAGEYKLLKRRVSSWASTWSRTGKVFKVPGTRPQKYSFDKADRGFVPPKPTPLSRVRIEVDVSPNVVSMEVVADGQVFEIQRKGPYRPSTG